jgi:hypothetical protein
MKIDLLAFFFNIFQHSYENKPIASQFDFELLDYITLLKRLKNQKSTQLESRVDEIDR